MNPPETRSPNEIETGGAAPVGCRRRRHSLNGRTDGPTKKHRFPPHRGLNYFVLVRQWTFHRTPSSDTRAFSRHTRERVDPLASAQFTQMMRGSQSASVLSNQLPVTSPTT